MLIIVESTTYPGTTERAHTPTLLRVFASVCETNPNAGLRLLIVGSGPMLPDLERLVGELGITKQSRFVPTTAAVADRLREIDVFVLPSLTEAFSNALMEAMACGCTPASRRASVAIRNLSRTKTRDCYSRQGTRMISPFNSHVW